MLIDRLIWVYYRQISNCCRPVLTDRLLIMYGILLQHRFLCYSSCVQSVMGFLYGRCERLFILNYIINILPDKCFKKSFFWVAKSYMAVCFNYFLSTAIFLNIDISQGSVATYLRWGGKFKHDFVANLPLSLSAKNVWRSVNIWGSYGQEFSVLYFVDSRCTIN